MLPLQQQLTGMLVGVLTAVVLFSTANAQHGGWGYSSDNGPATWPNNYPNWCNGQKQSPIDVQSKSAVQKSFPALNFKGFDTPPADAQMRIKNNGHAIQVDLLSKTGKTDNYQISGGGLPGTYNVLQFHFHWGSEHTVNGKRYDAEMHMVTWNTKYRDVYEARDNNGLATFSVPIAATSQTANPGMQNIVSQLSNVANKGMNYTYPTSFSVNSLFPADKANYWRYMGSLTTPKCNEVVVWTIFKTSLKISQDQINALKTSCYFNSAGDQDQQQLNNNYRTTNPLNGRTVFDSSNTSGVPQLAPTVLALVIAVLSSTALQL
ncbi:carbonic anhydrase 2-like isoform X2 [Branchiostoma floridae]|uniref:Carbonic anhydrase n=1 Tax=Branchiostoma floridae TaxID=7739 RepID=A0A9J7M0V5_BRAFL|nr:carbonic anhydrase 2-like isoform X2 [Branchiostoma floridae]